MTIARLAVIVLGSLFLLYAAVGVAVVLAAIVAGAWKTYVRRPRKPEPTPALDVARNVRLDELADLMQLPSFDPSPADLWALFDAPALIPAHERGNHHA